LFHQVKRFRQFSARFDLPQCSAVQKLPYKNLVACDVSHPQLARLCGRLRRKQSKLLHLVSIVNSSAYMNFKSATDGLFSRINHAELAKVLNVSVASIRQARLKRTTTAFREPPRGWQKAVVRLAHERIAQYRRLIDRLLKGT
jgi:hypothetical protein